MFAMCIYHAKKKRGMEKSIPLFRPSHHHVEPSLPKNDFEYIYIIYHVRGIVK
jgi:hypothetical protein